MFGNWEIINPYTNTKNTKAECLCNLCGTIHLVSRTHLRQGASTKCIDCYKLKMKQNPNNTTHGMSETREYRIWKSMKKRINNPSGRDAKNYRGIKMSKEWNSFENFYRDMGKIPEDGIRYSIGRIDNNGHYCKENCRWETDIQQANNTRRNKYITYKGETMSMADWARKLNINYYKLRGRLTSYGWSVKKSFNIK